MFTRATRPGFGTEQRPAPLTAAFAEFRAAVDTIAGGYDVDTLAEVLWAALHGLVVLGRNGWLRPGQHSARIDLVINQFDGS